MNKIRTDLTATIFLSDSETYEGGDLVIKDSHTSQCVKAPAGHMLLYSSGSRQEVRAVTSGISYRCTISIQSMIRDDVARTLLFNPYYGSEDFYQFPPKHPQPGRD